MNSAKSQHLRDNIAFAALQWFFWAGFGLLFDFLVAFLESAGYGNLQIGTVMGMVSLFSIIGQPIWGYVTDRAGSTKQVMRIAFLIAAVSVLGLLMYGERSFVAVLTLSVIASFTLQPIAPLIDSWSMRTAAARGSVNYGITRAMGSVGFSVTVALGGRLMDSWGMHVMFYGHLLMLSVAFLVTSLITESDSGRHAGGTETTGGEEKPQAISTGFERNPIVLFKNKEIVTFLIVTILIFTAFRAGHIYLPMLIQELGGANRHLGMALSVMAVSEVPMLALSTWILRKYEDVTVLLWGFLFFTIRAFLHLVVATPWGVVAIQAAQSVSFALFLPASVHFMHRVAPEGLKTTAQTLAAASSFGVGSVLGSFLGSVILEFGTIFDVYRYAGGLATTTVLIYYLAIYRKRHHRRVAHGV